MKESLLLLILLIGFFCDLLTHKIPNKLILCGGMIGSAIFLYEQGIAQLPFLVIGAFLPFFILIVPYGIGALGAGDIKLFSIMPAFLGIKAMLTCMIYAFIFAALLSFIFLLFNKCLIKRFKIFLKFLITVVHTGKLVPYYDVKKDGYKYVIHFSLAILLGTCLYFVQQIY